MPFDTDNPSAAALPAFVTVTDFAPLDVPTGTLPKDSDPGTTDNYAAGAEVPVPESEMGIVLPPPVIV